jgi:hypothetical protein
MTRNVFVFLLLGTLANNDDSAFGVDATLKCLPWDPQ